MKSLYAVIERGWKWAIAVPSLGVAIVGVFSWPAHLTANDKVVIVAITLLIGTVIGLAKAAHDLSCDLASAVEAEPEPTSIRVRYIDAAGHLGTDSILVILEKAAWVEAGLVLLLTADEGEITRPLALLHVEGFTSKGFPQCVVFLGYDDDSESLVQYLKDRSRWASFAGRREVRLHHLEKLSK